MKFPIIHHIAIVFEFKYVKIMIRLLEGEIQGGFQ